MVESAWIVRAPVTDEKAVWIINAAMALTVAALVGLATYTGYEIARTPPQPQQINVTGTIQLVLPK
jgi:hypothetical protein